MSDIRPLENEKLIFVNQNDVKVKGRGHFFKNHTKSFDIIFTWSNAEKALYQFYRNRNDANIKHDKMVIKTSDCSRTISLLVLYWNLMTMGLESWASNATGDKKKSCLDHAVA